MRATIGRLTRAMNTNNGFRKIVRSRKPGAGKKWDNI